MALISIPNTFTVGAVIVASQHNSNFSTIYSDYNGNVDNNNIAASAAIVDTKLAQISTASKVSGAALTSLSSVPSGAGQLPGVNGGIPSGCILMWSGTIATIPSGFVLCNGSNSTPDLRNQFICCADADSGGAAKTTVTGAALQSHATGLVLAHTHAYDTPPTPGAGGSGASYSGTPGSSTTGAVNSGNSNSKNIPVFYALAYIMKT